MARFDYTAYNQSGVRQSASLSGASEDEVRAQLEDQGLIVVSIDPASEQTDVLSLLSSNRLNAKDIEFFTSEIALLLQSGLRVERGLRILLNNVERKPLRELIETVLNDLKKGTALSESLSQFSAFDNLYISLIKIAEETGEMTSTFQRLSDELKYQLQLSGKIKQALVYPAVILTVCILAILFIFNFVVPNLTSLFSDEQNLPLYTELLLSTSAFMQSYQWFLIGGVAVLTFGLYQNRDKPSVQSFLLWIKENAPLLKSSNLLVERIRFNSALATMLSSGVAIDKALRLAMETIKTQSLRYEVRTAIEQITKGGGLAQSLGETRLYPPYFASLLSIGEESGQLEKVFTEIAERSRQNFYDWVTRFTSLLEPLLILAMGAIVGSVVVIMMLSISAVTDMEL
ncbi:MAG: type II secretion system F family protein [Pseudomonadota bacterium]